jgi:NADH:ubiquinone oxidoreductase subunit 3 (subunit A)
MGIIQYFFVTNLFVYLVCTVVLCAFLAVLYSTLDLCYNTKEIVKSSTYECGFVPYSEANIQVDLNFGAIAVLFIIFDLETIMLLPIITDHNLLDSTGYLCIILFIFTFIVGLFYEIKSQIITL